MKMENEGELVKEIRSDVAPLMHEQIENLHKENLRLRNRELPQHLLDPHYFVKKSGRRDHLIAERYTDRM